MLQRVVADVPTWVLAFLLVGCLPILSVGGLLACRSWIKTIVGEGHNEVPGFMFATLGVLYAVILAFLILAVWEAWATADSNTARESSALLSTYRDAEIFPAVARNHVRIPLLRYTNLVINDEWQTQREGRASTHARDALTAVYRAFATLRPGPSWRGADQEALTELNDMTALRTLRILASRQSLPNIFWLLLVLGAFATIAFSFLFYMESLAVQVIGTAFLAAVIGTALLLVLEVNYPFTGDVSISSDGFRYVQEVMRSITGG